MNKNPTKVYMIACEEDRQDNDGLYGITVVCHNIGVFFNEAEANLRCVGLNAERLDDDDDVQNVVDYYFVLPVEVRDAPGYGFDDSPAPGGIVKKW